MEMKAVEAEPKTQVRLISQNKTETKAMLVIVTKRSDGTRSSRTRHVRRDGNGKWIGNE